MKHKCNWCDRTTDRPLSDFDEIEWNAVTFGKEKSVCACPDHFEDLKKYMTKMLG